MEDEKPSKTEIILKGKVLEELKEIQKGMNKDSKIPTKIYAKAIDPESNQEVLIEYEYTVENLTFLNTKQAIYTLIYEEPVEEIVDGSAERQEGAQEENVEGVAHDQEDNEVSFMFEVEDAKVLKSLKELHEDVLNSKGRELQEEADRFTKELERIISKASDIQQLL